MPGYHRPDAKKLQDLRDIANKLRILSIESTQSSNSGHPTTCCSIAEVMSVLFFKTMKYSVQEPRHPSSDRFVLSKGHAAPILYAAWALAGLFPEEELKNLRKIDSDLEGHPTPRLNFIDVATGSLGQGLSCAAGMAYTGKYFDRASYRVYCIMGDGESAEGSIWEAMSFASLYNLDNLVAIFDINRLGQSEATPLQHQMDIYRARCEAFGFNTIVVDGHDVEALCKVFDEAQHVKGKPTAVLLKTFKGKGLDGIEDAENWHGKPLGDKAPAALEALRAQISGSEITLKPEAPVFDAPEVDISDIKLSSPPSYQLGEKIATRLAYGTAIAKLGSSNDRVIALDGDTKNSTYSDKFKKAHPDRYVECFIAEQNLVGVAIGCGTRSRTVPFVSTFAAFFTRTFDQLRMGAISQANIKCAGSHAGISIGEDGPSQMALEDLAMFRSIPRALVLYPSDAVSTERACELAANYKGIVFIRTSRPATAVLYDASTQFAAGKAQVVLQSDSDKVLVIGAGVTLHEALAAARELQKKGTQIRVMDIFSVKPIDSQSILSNARQCGGKIIVVEDHYPEGGIGDAVASVVKNEDGIKVVAHLCVRDLPRSGPPSTLLDVFKISSSAIQEAVLAQA
ncbi:transketolase [Galendromus occidentalis]|uniref:Transketolase n=1 Tax=Galendromus occidentalis TaxID=34638 RepID=A0AAJ6VZW7_9ACAR|nr:transketolase [Galendromus occidentalis]